jgi:hypothetical protein
MVFTAPMICAPSESSSRWAMALSLNGAVTFAPAMLSTRSASMARPRLSGRTAKGT